MSTKETVVYGIRAALALAEHRPKAIRRVLYSKALRKTLGTLLKATAAHRKPYREVEGEDLNRVAATTHHEGVVVVAAPLLTHPFGPRKQDLIKARCLIAVDNVSNPQNLGAILRSMAWFGADALLTNDPRTAVNPAAIRVSQGGAETVPIIRCSDLSRALASLAESGTTIIGADQNASSKPRKKPKPAKCCIVLGSETHGISEKVLKVCTHRIAIPGCGAVESLNVGVAAGIMLAREYAVDG